MAANLPLILALDVSGQPHRWINYEAAAYYYSKEAVAWSLGEHDYTIYGGTQRISGLRSSLTMNTILTKFYHIYMHIRDKNVQGNY